MTRGGSRNLSQREASTSAAVVKKLTATTVAPPKRSRKDNAEAEDEDLSTASNSTMTTSPKHRRVKLTVVETEESDQESDDATPDKENLNDSDDQMDHINDDTSLFEATGTQRTLSQPATTSERGGAPTAPQRNEAGPRVRLISNIFPTQIKKF